MTARGPSSCSILSIHVTAQHAGAWPGAPIPPRIRTGRSRPPRRPPSQVCGGRSGGGPPALGKMRAWCSRCGRSGTSCRGERTVATNGTSCRPCATAEKEQGGGERDGNGAYEEALVSSYRCAPCRIRTSAVCWQEAGHCTNLRRLDSVALIAPARLAARSRSIGHGGSGGRLLAAGGRSA